MPGEQYLLLQMHELLTFLNQRGCITLMIMGAARAHRGCPLQRRPQLPVRHADPAAILRGGGGGAEGAFGAEDAHRRSRAFDPGVQAGPGRPSGRLALGRVPGRALRCAHVAGRVGGPHGAGRRGIADAEPDPGHRAPGPGRGGHRAGADGGRAGSRGLSRDRGVVAQAARCWRRGRDRGGAGRPGPAGIAEPGRGTAGMVRPRVSRAGHQTVRPTLRPGRRDAGWAGQCLAAGTAAEFPSPSAAPPAPPFAAGCGSSPCGT